MKGRRRSTHRLGMSWACNTVGLLALSMVSLAHANDSAFGGSGAHPYPIELSEVEMVRERVELKLIGWDRWEVSCLFVFRNVKDEPVTVQMGFPFPEHEGDGDLAVPRGYKAPKAGRPIAYGFRAWVRDKPVNPRLKRVDANRKLGLDFEWAYLWPVKLKPAEQLEVRNTFVLGVSSTVMSWFTDVSYLLRSGKVWHGGRIGRAQLQVSADQPFRLCSKRGLATRFAGMSFSRASLIDGLGAAIRPQPGGMKVVREGKQTRLQWDLRRFKPEKDLQVCIVPASMHTEWLSYELSQADLNKLSAKQLRLVRNFYFARHGKRFKTPAIQRVFDGQWWYRPNPGFKRSMLDQSDWAGIKRVRGILVAKQGPSPVKTAE